MFSSRPRYRYRLASQRREVHLQGSRQDPHISRDASALLEQHDIAGNQGCRLNYCRAGVAQHGHPLWHVFGECLHGAPACSSCAKAKVAFNMMTRTTATATTLLPTASDSAAASHNSRASG